MDCLVPALFGLMLVTFTLSKPISSSSESSQSSSSEEIPARKTTPKPAEPQSVKKNLQQVMTRTSPCTEKTIHQDTTEQTIHHDVTEQTIHHDVTEQTIHHDVTEQTIHHDTTEQTIHHDDTVIRINLIPLPAAVSAKPDDEHLRASYSNVTISTIQSFTILLNSSVTNPVSRGDNI